MEATAPAPAASPYWRNGRAKASNDPRALTGLTRQAQARRRHDLIKTFVRALGGPEAVGEVAMLQVKKAAELLALAESVRSSLMGAPTRDVTGLVRLEGEARRCLQALGLKAEAPPARARGLAIARQRWAEAAEKAKKAQAVTNAGEASATHTPGPSDGRAA